uniref:Uncharacterized protein n=1 Tax=Neobodo designis TaxID=312471 RepID=A0A7S1LHH2_NEODS
MSDGYRALCEEALRDTVGLWRWHKYTLWNVPGLGAMLGKVAAADIHGFHVVIDEAEVENAARGSRYSTLRYALLTSGQRRKEGGRRIYEFATMNFALAVGGILGTTWMKAGRQKFAFFDRRPLWAIASGFGVTTLGFIAVRMAFKTIGVGTWIAECSHRTALRRVQCVDCLEEMITFSDEQIADIQTARMPDPKPGQPPMPPELEAKFKESMLAQGKLIRKDQEAMRQHQREILRRHGVKAELSDEERRAEKLRRLGVVETGSMALPSQSIKGDESDPERAAKVIAAAEAEIGDVTAKVVASLPTAAMELPATCLCDVHRGLRTDPWGYEHPKFVPIFPKDRETAAKRAPVRTE